MEIIHYPGEKNNKNFLFHPFLFFISFLLLSFLNKRVIRFPPVEVKAGYKKIITKTTLKGDCI